MKAYDVERVRGDFPILRTSARGKSLVYLDNAATTQKPRAVIEAISRYYTETNANVHRAVHALSEKATLAYEASRKSVQRFVGAAEASEIAAEVTTSQRPAKLSRSQAAAERIEEEYAYITNDLRRVFILAAAMFALLIALNVIFRLAG